MKRFLTGLCIVFSLTVFVSVCLPGAKASAANPCVPALGSCKGGSTCPAPGKFLSLVPWYQYLTLEYDSDSKSCDVDFTLLPNGSQASSVPLVLLAILEDLVRIAGLAAVVYVIFGGVKYITSQGSPDQTKQAQQTIINAIIGLAIAVIATAMVSFIAKKLAG